MYRILIVIGICASSTVMQAAEATETVSDRIINSFVRLMPGNQEKGYKGLKVSEHLSSFELPESVNDTELRTTLWWDKVMAPVQKQFVDYKLTAALLPLMTKPDKNGSVQLDSHTKCCLKIQESFNELHCRTRITADQYRTIAQRIKNEPKATFPQGAIAKGSVTECIHNIAKANKPLPWEDFYATEYRPEEERNMTAVCHAKDAVVVLNRHKVFGHTFASTKINLTGDQLTGEWPASTGIKSALAKAFTANPGKNGVAVDDHTVCWKADWGHGAKGDYDVKCDSYLPVDDLESN